MVTHIIFDWGDTLMRDFPELKGAMAHWDKVVVIDGVEETLKKLSQKYVLVVATNANFSGTDLMKLALERGAIKKYFTHFYSSIDFGFRKPDPRFFLTIIDELKIKPDACVMVGNDYEKDILGSKKIGMKTILFDEKKKITKYNDADFVVEKITEIINLSLLWNQ